jgi:signal transduction histidine kinase
VTPVKGAQAARPRQKKGRGKGGRTARSPVTPATRPAVTSAQHGFGAGGAPQPGRLARTRGGGPRNWRVRTRLFALIAIPTATAVIISGIRIVTATRSAMAYQRVEVLANLGEGATALAQSLENERDITAAYIAQGKPAVNDIVLRQEYSYTDQAARLVTRLVTRIGTAYPAQTQARAAAMLTRIDALKDLRSAATVTLLPALVVIKEYTATIDDVLAMNDETAQGGGDVTLADTVRVLGIVSRMKEEASRQRAVLDVALTMGRFPPAALDELTAAQAEEQNNLAAFDNSATADQRQRYLDAVTGPLTARAQSQEQNAIARVTGGGSLASDPTTADDWYGAMSDTINRMRTVERELAGSVVARAKSLLAGAVAWALAVSVAVLLVLVISLICTIVIARSMVAPLRRLRSGALEVADLRLPEMVRQLGETGGEGPPPDVEPIDVDSTDEIGEVARAFDKVHQEALRLAANEAMLRGNVSAMFVNLSRRSQALVERQIELIDQLEQDERDVDRLASLFRMDHLATRMRRNSENLLVLAGHEVPRLWSHPVAIINVLRAALSEIEQFDRVSIDVQPLIALNGRVVSDVIHLVAELVENATTYSPGTSAVTVSGHLLNSGGLLLDITDQGVGMDPDEMAHANWMLDNPPVVDVAVSRRMGLFVVARLAARHEIRVRLRQAPAGGLTALVWLPDELVTKEASGTPLGSRRPASSGQAGGAAAHGAGWQPASGLASSAGIAAASGAVPGGPAAGGPPASAGMPMSAGAGTPGQTAQSAGAAPAGGTAKSAAAGRVAAAVAAARAPRFAESQRLAADGGGSDDAGRAADDSGGPAGTGSGPAGGGFAADPDPAAARPGDGVDRLDLRPVLSAPVDQLGWQPPAAPPPWPAYPGAPGPPAPGGPGPGPVVVTPPPPGAGDEGRLPIFEAVESEWFHHGRPPNDAPMGSEPYPAGTGDRAVSGPGWTSPADEGWRAAAVASSPVTGDETPAGLPSRIPKANLVPGTAAADAPAAEGPPGRSAEAIRERLAGLQNGVQIGRAAAQERQAPASAVPPDAGEPGGARESEEGV